MNFRGLRVAFVFSHLQGGGSERVALTMAKRFARWGISSVFVGMTQREQEFIVSPEVRRVYRREVSSIERDLIYLLPDKINFYSEENKVALAAYLLRQHIQIVFVTYLDGRFFDDKLGLTSCRFVYWHHTMPFAEHFDKAEWDWARTRYSLKWWIYWNFLGRKYYYRTPWYTKRLREEYRQNILNFDRFIVLCSQYKTQLEKELLLSSYDTNKIYSIINTVPIEKDPRGQKSKIVVWVGRLRLPAKRYDRMLKIWQKVQFQLPDWTLRFYGSGDDIVTLISKYGLERVEVCGFSSDMSEIYDHAAVLCSTSTYEGWPMVIAEAQNNGVVPISFNCCQGVESMLASTFEAGVLVKPFDLDNYAEELVRLCQDEDYRRRLQSNCLIKRMEYAPDVNDRSWEAFFTSLLR